MKELPGKQYEQMAGSVLRILFGMDREGCTGTLLHNTVLTGASGVGHEMDIVLEVSRDSGKTCAAVECKNHGRPLEKEIVAAFSCILQDINALRGKDEQLGGVIVSSGGFQSGAVEMGKYYGIILLEIRPPEGEEWDRYIQTMMRESRREIQTRYRMKRDLTLDARTNERIVIVPDKSWRKENHAWETNAPLGKNAFSLVYKDRNTGKAAILPELLRKLPAEGPGIRRRVVLENAGAVLHHLVWNEDMPVSRIEYTYDDLTADVQDTVLFGRERPDILVFARTIGWWGGIWKGRFGRLPDPLREIREYEGKIKIHRL